MKPGMIRWKVRPSKNRPLVHCPDSRSTYFFVPSAKPTKFSTVLGAWNGYRSRVMAPLLVWRVVLSWSATGGPSTARVMVTGHILPWGRVGLHDAVGRA